MTNRRKLNFREYTALFYLNNGNRVAFEELLLKDIYPKDYVRFVKQLAKDEYITQDKQYIYITKKGTELVTNKNKDDDIYSSSIEWIHEFRKLFPPRRLTSIKEIVEVMDNFMKERKISDKNIIIEATIKYMVDQADTNMKYVKKDINFINTDLSKYCDYILLQRDVKELNTINGKIMI